MYIPRIPHLPFHLPSSSSSSSSPDAPPVGLGASPGPPSAPLRYLISAFRSLSGGDGTTASLARRQSPGSSQDINVTIGVIVGVVLGVFIIGACAFLWTYRYSVRFQKRRKHRHRRKSSGSKSSKSSAGGDLPAAPPPPA